MDDLPAEVFVHLHKYLTRADLVRLACTCRRLYDVVTSLWCYAGISLRQTSARDVLVHPKWQKLRKLRIWALWFPPDQIHMWQTFPSPLPCLEELELDRAVHPNAPWEAVLGAVPALRTLHVTTRLGITTSDALNSLVGLVRVAAPRVETLSVRCEGMVLYPDSYSYRVFSDDPLVDAVKAIYAASTVSSTTLRTYSNTGKQACVLAVDAPLHTLELEEGEQGPEALARIGHTCDASVRSLTLRAASDRLPQSGVRSRFTGVEHFSLAVERVRDLGVLCAWLRAEVPVTTTHLALDLDMHWFLPDEAVRWPLCLHGLERLETLDVTLSTAPLGSSDLVRNLLGAPSSLRRATITVRWCAVAAVTDQMVCTDFLSQRVDAEETAALYGEVSAMHLAAEEHRQGPVLVDLIFLQQTGHATAAS